MPLLPSGMGMSPRTSLEQYLAATIQMLMARLDGRDEDPYLDKLDKFHSLLTEEDRQFLDEMGQDWSTHYWCKDCQMTHLKSSKCPYD